MVDGMGAGQFAIYGSIKEGMRAPLSFSVLVFDKLTEKALGATGGVEIL
jgi:hypothetical protein